MATLWITCKKITETNKSTDNIKEKKELDKQVFCFQCEQTAGCSGCTGKAGVCGKTADTAALQDELTGALIGLARVCANNERKETTDRVVIEGLFTTVTNVAFDDDSIREMISKVNAEKNKIVPDCAVCASRCGNTDNYDMTVCGMPMKISDP